VSRFVLQPSKIREDRVVPTGDEDLVLDTKELVTKFAPSRARPELAKLRSIRLGGFLGRAKSGRTGQDVLFFIWNHDRSNKLGFLLKSDPGFPDRMKEIYRVAEVDWGCRFEEVESGKKDRIPGDNVPRQRGLREAVQ
jgi:hypothetical protein